MALRHPPGRDNKIIISKNSVTIQHSPSPDAIRLLGVESVGLSGMRAREHSKKFFKNWRVAIKEDYQGSKAVFDAIRDVEQQQLFITGSKGP